MAAQAVAKSYKSLLDQIKATIETGRKQIEQIKALTYWKIGEDITKYQLGQNGRVKYGLIKRISDDLNICIIGGSHFY